MLISRLCEVLALTLLTAASTIADAERVSDKIYSILQSNHYCGRRLNATHQMGCSSDLGGNFGVVWVVDNEEDIDHLLKTGPTPPYIAVLQHTEKSTSFTRKNLLAFRDHLDRVSGVVFLDGDHEDSKLRAKPFSPEDPCPNRNSGLYVNDTRYSNCRRNPWMKETLISGLLYDDIPYPLFLINDKNSTRDILDCFNSNNVIKQSNRADETSKKLQAPYPLCGLQLDSFMMAARDSDLCLNSRFFVDELLQSDGRRCFVVDNNNIFAYYKPAIGAGKPLNNTNQIQPQIASPQSIVMLIAKLSSVSIFSEISPGADSTVSSIVTLLAVAEALGRVKNLAAVQSSTRNIAFAFLDSEPFDYTGSNRMIYNMMENTFPQRALFIKGPEKDKIDMMLNMNLTSIDYIINLDQMASYPNAESIYFHAEPDDRDNEKVNRLYDVMKKTASGEKLNFNREDAELPLPPTPVQEFIRYSRNSASRDSKKLTGIVLSNYGKTYSNLFYNSIYDDSHNIFKTSEDKLFDHVAKVSQFIAKSLFEITFEVDDYNALTVNRTLIEKLFGCYLFDASCPLFTRVTAARQKLPTGPIQTYKDPTKRSSDINAVITANLLAYFLGEKMPDDYNKSRCAEENARSFIYNYKYINDKDEPVDDLSSGKCIRSQVAELSSYSPAYSVTNDGVLYIDSKYPAWTVSLNGIRNPVRLYLKPSPLSQWATLILGIVITIASFLFVYRLREAITKIDSNVAVAQVATST